MIVNIVSGNGLVLSPKSMLTCYLWCPVSFTGNAQKNLSLSLKIANLRLQPYAHPQSWISKCSMISHEIWNPSFSMVNLFVMLYIYRHGIISWLTSSAQWSGTVVKGQKPPCVSMTNSSEFVLKVSYKSTLDVLYSSERIILICICFLPLGLLGRRGIVVACICLSEEVCGAACFMAAEIKFSKDVRLSVHKLYLVRTITRQRFELESPNLYQTCIVGYFQLVMKTGVIDLDLKGNFGHFDLEY